MASRGRMGAPSSPGTRTGARSWPKSPPREDAETTWTEALRRHGWHTLLGLLWAAGIYRLDAPVLGWSLPVVLPLMMSIPISVLTSRVSLGRRLRKARLLLMPEESWPPKDLRSTRKYLKAAPDPPGFVDAVMDPVVNAVACASGHGHAGQSPALRGERRRLVEAALIGGPDGLGPRRKMRLLDDPRALSRLHFMAWTSAAAHPLWVARRSSSARREWGRQAYPRLPVSPV